MQEAYISGQEPAIFKHGGGIFLIVIICTTCRGIVVCPHNQTLVKRLTVDIDTLQACAHGAERGPQSRFAPRVASAIRLNDLIEW
ncbi:hypothetical protein ABIA53_002023 [Pseudomonas monsensis]